MLRNALVAIQGYLSATYGKYYVRTFVRPADQSRSQLGMAGISTIKEVKQSCKNDENYQTRLRASRTTREPVRSVKAEVKQMAGNGLAIVAGVGLSENHHVGIIRGGVKTYRKPQTSGAA